jgi:hypothetical protein
MINRPTQPDHVPATPPRLWSQLRDRLMGCFGEMPGLIGTAQDLARLIGTTPQLCQRLLDRLAEEQRIRRTRDGRYTSWAEH